jgi:hypothetical protein
MIANYAITQDGKVVTYQEDITKKTDYDVIFGSENKLVASTQGGSTRTLLPTLKSTTLVWAQDGKRYAYSKEGKVWLASVDDTMTKQIAGPTGKQAEASSDTSKEARDRRDKERFTAQRFSPKGDVLIVTNKEGLWLLDVATGTKELFLESDTTQNAPQRSVIGWTEDGNTLFLSYASRTKWERGLLRYDRTTKKLEEVVKDGRTYSGIRFAKDGRSAVLNIALGNRRGRVPCRRRFTLAAPARRDQSAACEQAVRQDRAHLVPRRRRPPKVGRRLLSGGLPVGQTVSDGLQHLRGVLRRLV